MSSQTTQNDDLIILSDNIPTSFDWNNPIVSDASSENVVSEQNPVVLQTADESVTQEQNTSLQDNNPIISFDSGDSAISLNPETTEDNQNETSASTENSMENLISFNDNNSETSDIFNLWETNEWSSETPINLWETENLDSQKIEDGTNSFDFWWINISWLWETSEEQEKTEENPLSDSSWENINFWIWEQTEDIEEGLDMNSILNNTIEKLKKRQDWISSKRWDKTQKIEELELKIKDLKDQVTELKKEITDLDEENGNIELNVWHLEEMKLWKAPKIASKTRVPNTKKVIK